MRIGVAQVNPVLGDFRGNKDKILQLVSKAKERRCDLVVFPEAALFGYHPFDLLERPEVIDRQDQAFAALQKEMPSGVGAIFGLLTRNKNKKGRPLFNSAVLVEKGRKPIFFNKQLLPTGDVFDEARFIAQGEVKNNFFSYKGCKFFLTICEDIWAWPKKDGSSDYDQNPLAKLPKKKVDFVINMSASPFYPGKDQVRRALVQKTAAHFKAPMLYCNLVGGQDEIIFDGQSFILDPRGKELLRCLAFNEDFNVFDLELKEGALHPQIDSSIEEIRQALILGIRDFCEKTGLERIHFGLSGGIDSALVAALAVDALGPARVKAFYLPTEFSSDLSRTASFRLAKNLGLELTEFSIQKLFKEFSAALEGPLGLTEFGTVHENLQARIRGIFLMAYANQKNSLLLSTANKAELAAGYSTLYGDVCGGLMPIGDLTKSQVVELCRHYNAESEIIPKEIIERPPSAELRPNQKDQDSLPPYSQLDESVVRIVENNQAAKSETDRWLVNALTRSEFKRWQAPPILKVSRHSFGRGRRWPVAHRALSPATK